MAFNKQLLLNGHPNGLYHWHVLMAKDNVEIMLGFSQQMKNPDAKVKKICSLVVATAAVYLAYSLESF